MPISGTIASAQMFIGSFLSFRLLYSSSSGSNKANVSALSVKPNVPFGQAVHYCEMVA
jgi:hypothetical protein